MKDALKEVATEAANYLDQTADPMAKALGKRLYEAMLPPAPRRPSEIAISAEEAEAHGDSDTCPKCGETGDYSASQFGDSDVYQDAICPNGHRWREISRLVSIVGIDADGDEVGTEQPCGNYRPFVVRATGGD